MAHPEITGAIVFFMLFGLIVWVAIMVRYL